jgi:hypothetical protein
MFWICCFMSDEKTHFQKRDPVRLSFALQPGDHAV